MRKLASLGVLAVAPLFVCSAHASTLSLAAGTNWSRLYNSSVTPGVASVSSGSQLGYEGGAFLDLGSQPFGFEIGGLFEHHKTAFGSGNLQYNDLQIPAVVRLAVGPFSFGAGGYYSFGEGSVTKEDQTGTQTYNGDFGGAGLKSSDYGILGSVRVGAQFSTFGLFLDGRYCYGLKNINGGAATSGSLYTREVQALFGVAIPLGR